MARLRIDGRIYNIPDSQIAALLADFRKGGEEIYHQQGDWLRFGLKQLVRVGLEKWEEKLARHLGKVRAAEICRTPRKKDPVIHAGEVALLHFQGMIQYAELNIETDGEQTTAFNLSFPAPGEARGQMAADGNQRERQDNSAQTP